MKPKKKKNSVKIARVAGIPLGKAAEALGNLLREPLILIKTPPPYNALTSFYTTPKYTIPTQNQNQNHAFYTKYINTTQNQNQIHIYTQ